MIITATKSPVFIWLHPEANENNQKKRKKKNNPSVFLYARYRIGPV
jgi:hypothetical protein